MKTTHVAQLWGNDQDKEGYGPRSLLERDLGTRLIYGTWPDPCRNGSGHAGLIKAAAMPLTKEGTSSITNAGSLLIYRLYNLPCRHRSRNFHSWGSVNGGVGTWGGGGGGGGTLCLWRHPGDARPTAKPPLLCTGGHQEPIPAGRGHTYPELFSPAPMPPKLTVHTGDPILLCCSGQMTFEEGQ